jgi:glycosyltransferase involved in cell wall biosynthesis
MLKPFYLLFFFLCFICCTGLNAAEVLHLDLEVAWILQGRTFSFTGFFMEFLGVSSALLKYLPQFRLIQSSFNYSFDESGISSNVINLLFEKERNNILDLYSVQQRLEFNLVTDSLILSDNFPVSCSETELSDTSNLIRMWRYMSPGKRTPQDCCIACTALPNCLGWSLSFGELGTDLLCELKGSLAKHAAVNEILSTHPRENIIASGSLLSVRKPSPKFKIFHGTTCFYQNWTSLKPSISEVRIGRYMVEREQFKGGMTLHEMAVMKCAVQMDEIWVPTEWNKRIFEKYLNSVGFAYTRVFVIPEAVDASLFDPRLSRRASASRGPWRGNKLCRSDVAAAASPGGDSAATFQFLSIFKWEDRKGWDVLLRSYWTAFDLDDDVLLRLHTYVPAWVKGETNVLRIIEQFAQSEFGRSLADLPKVSWEVENSPNGTQMSREDMRDLYSSADAFVLPTRGEGWGLPIAEAMAMEIPVIVTNFSGPQAYATSENAYLIPVKPGLDQLGFGIPDSDALARIMKEVVIDSCPHEDGSESTARRIARAGRAAISAWSPDYVALEMVKRLRELAAERGYQLTRH